MNRPLISVIVPVYNIENYLDECIMSIVQQTYAHIEIIIVNDGATDRSGLISREWEKKDSRVCVIDKQNGGLSDARNYGLQKASGEYICFVDGDDTIDENYIETLYKNIIKYDADLAVCHFYQNNFSTNEICYSTRISDKTMCVDCNKYMEFVYNNTYYATACIKLGKRKIYEGILFPKNKKHEDSFVILDLVLKCKRICIIPDYLYFYRQRECSIMNNSDEILYMDDFGWIKYHIDVLEKIHNEKLLFEAKKLFCHNFIKNHKYLSEKNKIIVKNLYKKYYNDIIFSVYMPIKTRIKYMTIGLPIWQ